MLKIIFVDKIVSVSLDISAILIRFLYRQLRKVLLFILLRLISILGNCCSWSPYMVKFIFFPKCLPTSCFDNPIDENICQEILFASSLNALDEDAPCTQATSCTIAYFDWVTALLMYLFQHQKHLPTLLSCYSLLYCPLRIQLSDSLFFYLSDKQYIQLKQEIIL